jgi:hypothetical protein
MPSGKMNIHEFTDINLVAYTWYSYIITVCTAGGCSASKPTLVRTHETSPVQVAPPSISVLSSTALNISWIVPSVSNGIIINYILFMDNSEVYRGAMLSYVKTNGIIGCKCQWNSLIPLKIVTLDYSIGIIRDCPLYEKTVNIIRDMSYTWWMNSFRCSLGCKY